MSAREQCDRNIAQLREIVAEATRILALWNGGEASDGEALVQFEIGQVGEDHRD